MKYVDGFVFAVKKKKVAAYIKMARSASSMWKRLGAQDYFECQGDDLYQNMGMTLPLSFPKLIKLKKDETVWFSFITYKSKAARNKANKKMFKEMDEHHSKSDYKDLPFDLKRMAMGGFKARIVK